MKHIMPEIETLRQKLYFNLKVTNNIIIIIIIIIISIIIIMVIIIIRINYF